MQFFELSIEKDFFSRMLDVPLKIVISPKCGWKIKKCVCLKATQLHALTHYNIRKYHIFYVTSCGFRSPKVLSSLATAFLSFIFLMHFFYYVFGFPFDSWRYTFFLLSLYALYLNFSTIYVVKINNQKKSSCRKELFVSLALSQTFFPFSLPYFIHLFRFARQKQLAARERVEARERIKLKKFNFLTKCVVRPKESG